MTLKSFIHQTGNLRHLHPLHPLHPLHRLISIRFLKSCLLSVRRSRTLSPPSTRPRKRSTKSWGNLQSPTSTLQRNNIFVEQKQFFVRKRTVLSQKRQLLSRKRNFLSQK